MMKILLLLISMITLIACGTTNNTTSTTSTEDAPKNNLTGVSWKINGPAFINETADSYTLTPPPKEENKFPDFGHFVEFKTDGTFSGHYSAQCGNDCFTSVDGNYTLITDNQVKIFIEKASNRGYCNDTFLIEKKDMGSFEIIPQKDKSFLLKKI